MKGEPAEKSQAAIRNLLEKICATNVEISKQEIRFALPALQASPSYCIPVIWQHLLPHLKDRKQAENLAWFRMRRWFETSIDVIHLRVSFSRHEVFFPYLISDHTNQATMYDSFRKCLGRTQGPRANTARVGRSRCPLCDQAKTESLGLVRTKSAIVENLRCRSCGEEFLAADKEAQ